MKPTILPFAGIAPKIDPTAFVAPGCSVIGDVEIGADASLWYNVVVRGDVDRIRIGARTNIQDGTIIHVTTNRYGTTIGDDVLIGHVAVIHGCVIESGGFVGMGAMVMDGCVIESGGRLAAGAMLTPGKRIPGGQLWAGRPAAYMRDVTTAEIDSYAEGIEHYVELGRQHAAAIAAADKV